jgi:hypothetical protein
LLCWISARESRRIAVPSVLNREINLHPVVGNDNVLDFPHLYAGQADRITVANPHSGFKKGVIGLFFFKRRPAFDELNDGPR